MIARAGDIGPYASESTKCQRKKKKQKKPTYGLENVKLIFFMLIIIEQKWLKLEI